MAKQYSPWDYATSPEPYTGTDAATSLKALGMMFEDMGHLKVNDLWEAGKQNLSNIGGDVVGGLAGGTTAAFMVTTQVMKY